MGTFGSKNRWLVACVLAGLVFSVSACSSTTPTTASPAGATASGSKPLIYVIGYVANNPFWNAEGKGAQAAGTLFHAQVRYEAPQTATDAGMIAMIYAALGTHPTGIAVDYTGKAMEAPVLKALQQGVNVVLYNNNRFEEQSGGATTNPAVTSLGFSGQNEHTSGEALANAFLPYLPKGGGRVLLGNAFPQAYVLTLRAGGVQSVLSAAGYTTDTLNLGTNSVTDEATIGAYLTAHPDIVAFIGLSGNIETNAAAQWVQSHHLSLPLATFDVSPQTISLMRSVASYDVALDQQPYLQGFYAVANLAMQAQYGFQPVQINTGSLIVTKENLDSVSKLVSEGVD